MSLLLRMLALLLCLFAGCAGAGETISLRIAALPDNRHVYYTELLQQSLRAIGYELHIDYVDDVPQPRIWNMVANKQLSVIWGVQTDARDRTYTAVLNPLTNGLMGQRVLLVRKGQEDMFRNVRTLDDFRRLGKIGGAGVDWFEVELWKLNGLPLYVKTGNWRQMFAMLASGQRGIDYMVRGVTEVSSEVLLHEGVAVERNLMLTHERDMRFYLSPDAARYRPLLERALAEADKSGLKKKLIAQYLLPGVEGLNLDKRVRLKLAMPPR